MKIAEVYDLESLSNLFTYTGYDYKNDIWHQYVICEWRNDIEALYNHCMNDIGLMIGYNVEAYDYPLLHHILRHYEEYKNDPKAAELIFEKSQQLIKMEFSAIADKNKIIPQIDLYLVFHYNNKARHQSLKGLEIQMRMDNVEEMPLHYTHVCVPGDEVLILGYNKNDVLATYKFLEVALGKTDYPLYKGKNKIKLRLDLQKQFHVNVLNKGDVPMGEELILQLYSRAANINPYQLKKCGGTPRPNGINLKDCIPSWCKLESPEFIKFLEQLKNTTIKGDKGEFSFSVIFHEYKFDFGQGGAHGSAKPQVWVSNNDWMIADYDIGSLYPSLAKSLGLYPEHLGKLFLNQYVGFIDDRLAEKHKPKEERNNTLIEGYKLILNGAYGKSKEESSFLYDPLYTFRTTIAGQLFICMWAERWVKVVPELKFIQTNTDGQTIYIPRNKISLIREVNEQLTKETGLTIEETIYSKMFVRDVNNYGAVYEDSTTENEHIKLKGDYEIYKEFHKDPSMRIVPYAVKQYFVYGIPIEKTIKECTDIFDFCLQLKCNSNSYAEHCSIDKQGNKIITKLDRTTRYYISEGVGSGTLQKHFNNGSIVGVNIGYSTTIFNKYIKKPFNEYNINYKFYIIEAKKLIDAIVDNQLSLF